jgi:L-threonylcarbamoyladenylate synthase
VETRTYAARGRALSEGVRAAASALDRGEVVVLPTDTVYGLAAGAFRPHATDEIYRLKGRDYRKPLPFLVARLDQALALVEDVTPRLKKLLDRYWPGPLTVVFKTSSLGRWVTGGKDTIAVRIPKHPAALALLRAVDGPLAATSANPSGRAPAVTAAQALGMFGGRVPVVLDGGRCPEGEASTVLDAAGYPWTLVREGAVKRRELLRYL